MIKALKIAAGALAALVLLALLFVAATLLFPRRFAPRTTELRAPSGAVYRILQRGPFRGPEAGGKTFGVRYLADRLDEPARLSREADELEALVKPELEAGGYGTLVVMASQVTRQVGFLTVSSGVNTVIELAPGASWEIFSSTVEAVPVELAPERAELCAAYEASNRAVVEKDPRALFDMETPDYTDVLIDGRVLDKQADMTEMQKQFAELASISTFTSVIAALSVEGPRATALVRSAFHGAVNDDKRPGQVYYSEGWSQDAWTRTPAGWRVSRSEDLASKSFFFKP